MNIRAHKIGIVIPSLHEPCQSLMWDGLCHEAKTQRIELITLVATSQDRTDTLDSHTDVMEQFVSRLNLDGVVVFTGAVAECLGIDAAVTMVARMARIPVVSLNYRVPGVSCVLPNNTAGVVEMVDHLVTQHNRQRIVFVKGPQGHEEAEERLNAYRAGIARNGITFDPRLVLDGGFSMTSGVAAVRRLFSMQIMFDAVMCADDETALGVISELRKRGRHVPTDVSVAGFDDIERAASVLPSLSTVSQPLFQMGQRGLLRLIDSIEGRIPGADVTILDTFAVFRRSCGCFPSQVRDSRPPDESRSASSPGTFSQNLMGCIGRILGRQLAYVDEIDAQADSVVGSLLGVVDAFEQNIDALDGQDLFLNALDTFMFRIDPLPRAGDAVQQLLIELSGYLATGDRDVTRLTNGNHLLQKGAVLLREYKLRGAQARNAKASEFNLLVREACQQIITTFEPDRLRRTVYEAFPRLGIPFFCLALYENKFRLGTDVWEFPDKSRLLMGYDQMGHRLFDDLKDDVFDTRDLVPVAIKPLVAGRNLVLLPLFFQEQHFGYLLFVHDGDRPHFMYEELRMHMGSAFRSSFIMQTLRLQSMSDVLTGLYNRRGFMALCDKLIDSAKRAGGTLLAFFVDVKGLKKINDTYGHDEGDRALVAAAGILMDTFRTQDVIARIGDDEFAVLIHVREKMTPGDVILERFTKSVSQFNTTTQRPFQLSMSIGSTCFDSLTDCSVDAVLKEADKQLFAKRDSTS